MHLRFGIVALAALLLAGCADGDWAHLTRYESPLSGPPRAESAPAPDDQPVAAAVNYRQEIAAENQSEPLCTRAAEERATDTMRQGFEDDIRKAVYDKTYADCMAWKKSK